MNDASLIITYKDGTTQELPMADHVVEIGLKDPEKQWIEFALVKGKWLMRVTKQTFQKEGVRSITFTNKTP